jgi:hypothetical protein
MAFDCKRVTIDMVRIAHSLHVHFTPVPQSFWRCKMNCIPAPVCYSFDADSASIGRRCGTTVVILW